MSTSVERKENQRKKKSSAAKVKAAEEMSVDTVAKTVTIIKAPIRKSPKRKSVASDTKKQEAQSVTKQSTGVEGGSGEMPIVKSVSTSTSSIIVSTPSSAENISNTSTSTIVADSAASATSNDLLPGLYRPFISKEEISTLPIAATDLEIVTVDKKSQVQKAIDDLMDSDLIGFDTETKPSFVKGVRNTVSLLQLSNARRCYLFRLQLLGRNNKLKELLENPNVRKVGLSVRDDFRALSHWMEVEPASFLELQTYVRAFGIEEMSLQKVFAIVFNRKISKRQQLSNWEARTLSEAQQLYAATDAWACREIYFKLRES